MASVFVFFRTGGVSAKVLPRGIPVWLRPARSCTNMRAHRGREEKNHEERLADVAQNDASRRNRRAHDPAAEAVEQAVECRSGGADAIARTRATNGDGLRPAASPSHSKLLRADQMMWKASAFQIDKSVSMNTLHMPHAPTTQINNVFTNMSGKLAGHYTPSWLVQVFPQRCHSGKIPSTGIHIILTST